MVLEIIVKMVIVEMNFVLNIRQGSCPMKSLEAQKIYRNSILKIFGAMVLRIIINTPFYRFLKENVSMSMVIGQ